MADTKLKLETPEPFVSIVILNYNGCDMLYECLSSILLTNYSAYEVVVVDNGSTDKSCAMIKTYFPQVKLVCIPENLGYSKGNNIGILHAKGDFIVLLNNDTVVSPFWLSELVREAKNQPECFYQPKILFMNSKRINSAGNCIQLFGFAFPFGIGKLDVNQYTCNHQVSYASGACILASRSLIQKVGLLDESDLFTFYEDVNWGWRALMMGYNSIYVSSSTIYHKWGGSWGNNMSSRKFFLIERARLATLLRNYSVRTLVSLFPVFLSIETCVLLYGIKNRCVSKKIKGYSDIIKARNMLINQKRRINKTRKNSDGVVINCFTDEVVHPYLGVLAVPANKVLAFLGRYFRILIK